MEEHKTTRQKTTEENKEVPEGLAIDFKEQSEDLAFVKALDANGIRLYRSPNATTLRIALHTAVTDQTAAYIKQASKIFPLKSLEVVDHFPFKIEGLEKNEQLFKFLREISTEMADLQELVICNRIEDKDLEFLKSLFPRLIAFGNNDASFTSFKEVEDYLDNFKSINEDDPNSKKLRLASLNLRFVDISQNQMDTLTPYLFDVHKITINSSSIESLVLPTVTDLYILNMPKLKELKAPEIRFAEFTNVALETVTLPKAMVVGLHKNNKLTTVDIPEAIDVNLRYNRKVQMIEARQALIFRCKNSLIKNLDLPVAKLVELENQEFLTNMIFPEAIGVTIMGNRNSREVITKKAERVWCINNESLEIIESPNSSFVYCRNCSSLKTLKAQKADVDLDPVSTPKTLEIPLKSLSRYYARKARYYSKKALEKNPVAKLALGAGSLTLIPFLGVPQAATALILVASSFYLYERFIAKE